MNRNSKFSIVASALALAAGGASAGPAEDTAKAAKVTAGVDGVAKVDSNLTVRGSERPAETVVDDAGVTAKVKAAVIDDPLTSATEINVDTNAGVVQLNGFVGTEAEKERAGELARKVEGVAVVKNNLMVKR